VGSNLLVSETAHLVFPYHRFLDEQRESNQGKQRIGTTKRGIGPAYADKASRIGLRLVDLLQPERFERRLRDRIREYNAGCAEGGTPKLSFAKVQAEYLAAGDQLRPHVINTVRYLHDRMQKGARLLFEGAQGTFLDIDHGTYPYVTSSNTTAGGACTGSGVPPNRIERVVGVMKAYTTRVGEGPLPSENPEIADLLHGLGREFGATTGRARRCGWFDAVVSRQAAMINGIDDLAVTNIDGLDTLETLRVCVGYRVGRQRFDLVPNDIDLLSRCEPVYAEFPGWRQPTDRARNWSDLPPKCRAYLKALAELTGAPVRIASVGPGREQTLFV
jgi:adenylosuccinate synthase